jgi:hypothetical protein
MPNRKGDTHLCIAGRQPPIPPRPAFVPLAGPANRPRRSHLPRAARGHCQVGPALRHADVVVVILPLSPLADDERPKRGAPAVASPSRRAPRLPAHPGHPRTLHRAALFKPPPSPSGAPNPSRPKGNSPDQPRHAAGGEGREGGKEEERSRPRGSRPP